MPLNDDFGLRGFSALPDHQETNNHVNPWILNAFPGPQYYFSLQCCGRMAANYLPTEVVNFREWGFGPALRLSVLVTQSLLYIGTAQCMLRVRSTTIIRMLCG